MGESLLVTLLIVIVASLVFLPSFAGRRKHNRAAIMSLNGFLGWMFLIWGVALVWDCCDEPLPYE
jgi:hypothetical protein